MAFQGPADCADMAVYGLARRQPSLGESDDNRAKDTVLPNFGQGGREGDRGRLPCRERHRLQLCARVD